MDDSYTRACKYIDHSVAPDGCNPICSSGFSAMLLGLTHACKRVVAVGFDLTSNFPGHYFDDRVCHTSA